MLLKPLDTFLNKITMYRLVVYVLGFYAALGITFAFFGSLGSSATAMVISLLLLLVSAYLADAGFAKLFNVPTNSESWLITGLILFLIVHPATSIISGVALVLAGAISSASKFLLARNEKHFFNPAALAATILSLTSLQATTWWIGGSLFWPFTLILGLAVVRKQRKFPLVATFIVAALVFQVLQIWHDHVGLVINMQHAIFSSPLIFLATIMLTEPATMPPRRAQQLLFAIIVALFYVGGWHIGFLIFYPEVALLMGNIYAYFVSPKFRLRLTLKRIDRLSEYVVNYVFTPNRSFTFLPGQYMEWTLAGVPYNSRGNRRSFTIASSPSEQDVQVGIKFYAPPSSYKTSFANLLVGDTIYASQLSGDFTMQADENKKLAFIAGGIGITPFRSMVASIIDSNVQRDIVLLYTVSEPSELAYMEVFQEAARLGVRTIPVITTDAPAAIPVARGRLSAQQLARLVPDYGERTFYISGPNVMVDATSQYLHELSIDRARIKTDHFSGY
jgi:ferredoxin-NADP reductase